MPKFDFIGKLLSGLPNTSVRAILIMLLLLTVILTLTANQLTNAFIEIYQISESSQCLELETRVLELEDELHEVETVLKYYESLNVR